MHQQLWGYKVEEKIYLGVRERKRLNITDVDNPSSPSLIVSEVTSRSHTSDPVRTLS